MTIVPTDPRETTNPNDWLSVPIQTFDSRMQTSAHGPTGALPQSRKPPQRQAGCRTAAARLLDLSLLGDASASSTPTVMDDRRLLTRPITVDRSTQKPSKLTDLSCSCHRESAVLDPRTSTAFNYYFFRDTVG